MIFVEKAGIKGKLPLSKLIEAGNVTGITDEQAIEAARKGDKKAFEELIRRYESKVAGTVIGMLGNCAETDDIGQETFIRFYRALGDFRGDASIGTYLTRIAINLSLNELKRRRRRLSRFFSLDTEEAADMPDRRKSETAEDDSELVHWGLQQISPDFRSVIVLRLLNGYSTEETAEILGIPQGTVLSRLTRGQRKLREVLAPVFGDV